MSHVTKPDGELYWAAVELELAVPAGVAVAAEPEAGSTATAVASVPSAAEAKLQRATMASIIFILFILFL
jgi:hypothetical protein